ncbi:unnamed protein product [Dovyalis caffra]|uniref:ATPase AAA-type core domain-containing protein n=1 Tax=Dovyalis caffra TaxID=77055 RepID=A0AAV1R4D4_9ROSI|nr:unnamed protein product [Dovyalis caffra]
MLPLQNRQTIIAFATVAASAILVRRIVDAFMPSGVRIYFSSLYSFSSRFSSHLLIVVLEEYKRPEFNQLFQAADSYWGTLVASSIIRDIEAEEETAIDKDHEILDVFQNVQVRWKLVSTKLEQFNSKHKNTTILLDRTYELTFHKKNKDTVLNMGSSREWQLDNTFDHTTTFKTVVMDTKLKKTVLDDLNTFMSAQEMYRSIGKAWNRRYLLCGPPGTGKSRLNAAMANHLNYDVYELDQTDVHIYCLMHRKVPNKSIFVFKDIDCDVELEDQEYVDGPENYGKNKVRTSKLLP